jgi:hypothetical protein
MNARWLALSSALLCCQLAVARVASPPPPDPSMPQVDIEAARARLHEMENQLYSLEDQFFGEYNKLNDIAAYKVSCGWEMHGKFRKHVCRPAFVEWSARESAFGFLSGSYESSWYDSQTPWITVQLRTREYQKHMTALVGKHPDLLKPLKERAELGVRYAELRKQFHWD